MAKAAAAKAKRCRYELSFEGGAAPYFPRYRRFHRDLQSAESEARRIFDIFDSGHPRHPQGGTVTASHVPQIYCPSGQVRTIRW